jgi:hypothetical protein
MRKLHNNKNNNKKITKVKNLNAAIIIFDAMTSIDAYLIMMYLCRFTDVSYQTLAYVHR